MGKLTARSVSSIKKPGMHSDGDGLYLNVSGGGAKSWILRVRVKGSNARREFGLGGLGSVSLAEARDAARALRAEAKAGRDPRATRDARTLTFADAAAEYHLSIAKTFRSEKHAASWLSSLRNHAYPRLGDMELGAIKRADVLDALRPIWTDKPETARRVKQRVGSVFDWAIGAGHYDQANPVDAALLRALPKVARRVDHHPALPWRDVPAFMAELGEREAVAARCLQFIILTAVRSSEARGARWEEIDLEAGVWSIPGARMKTGEDHRVPLSAFALDVLEGVKGLHAELVFPSPMPRVGANGQLSVNAFRPLFERMERVGLTVHGFRSTFRDWCAEFARADESVAEAALAHKVTGVRGAYLRSDYFDRRRELMGQWGRFASGLGGNVVAMVRA